jgi:hypothetical protein
MNDGEKMEQVYGKKERKKERETRKKCKEKRQNEKTKILLG